MSISPAARAPRGRDNNAPAPRATTEVEIKTWRRVIGKVDSYGPDNVEEFHVNVAPRRLFAKPAAFAITDA
jgi:hypothetical protein